MVYRCFFVNLHTVSRPLPPPSSRPFSELRAISDPGWLCSPPPPSPPLLPHPRKMIRFISSRSYCTVLIGKLASPNGLTSSVISSFTVLCCHSALWFYSNHCACFVTQFLHDVYQPFKPNIQEVVHASNNLYNFWFACLLQDSVMLDH